MLSVEGRRGALDAEWSASVLYLRFGIGGAKGWRDVPTMNEIVPVAEDIMETLIGTTLKGQTKSISIGEDAITIIPRALYHGFVGEKRIPYASITAVQFKEAGGWLAGFIQFTIKGAVEWRGQVNQDENALQFDKGNNAEFHALRDFVQRQMANSSAPPIASVADELSKLAALRDQGILSDEEFAAQKSKLLR